MGFFYPSLKVNALDLSPNYAGTLMAIVNGIGAISGAITPMIVGFIATNVSLMLDYCRGLVEILAKCFHLGLEVVVGKHRYFVILKTKSIY